MPNALTTTDVSSVFARNLRTLIADHPSISAVCRALEINRTQFNRYLSGEAHPRPEVLAKICAHFDVDGRILLTPLAEIRDQQMTGWPYAPAPDPFRVYRTGFDHLRMPDGLYQMILPNMVDPGKMVVELGRLFTTADGIKGLHYGAHRAYVESLGGSTLWRDRKLTGYVQQHIDGVSLLAADPHSRLLMLCYVNYGFGGNPTVHAGYAALTQARGPMQRQVQPFMMRKLPGTCAEVLAARRQHRDFSTEMLPRSFRQYFETWEAG